MKERWMDIKGFRYYRISNTGKIRRKRLIVDKRHLPGRTQYWHNRQITMKPSVPKNIAQVGLMDATGRRHWLQVKDLVANHWMRNRTKAVVALKNKKDPMNCDIRNLYEVGVPKKDRNTKLSPDEVRQIKADLKLDTERGRYARIAKKYRMTLWNISLIDKGRLWKDIE